jgi:PAS domain S-box-containing protein
MSDGLSSMLLSVLNTSTDAVILIRADGIILHVNDSTLRMFQYESTDLVGNNVSLLMPEPYRSAHDGYIKRYVATRQAAVIGSGRPLLARHANGQEFKIFLTLSGKRCRSVIIQ